MTLQKLSLLFSPEIFLISPLRVSDEEICILLEDLDTIDTPNINCEK